MIYTVTINGTQYEVDVVQGKAEIIRIETLSPQPVLAAAEIAPAVAQQAAPVSAGSGEPVPAPMPGAILDIKVRPGDAVKSGQVLLILEAMKMENEILAPRDGQVKDILVSKGANVATADVLLTLA